MNIVSKKLLIVIPTIVILFVAVMLSDTIEKRIDDISETIMDDELIGDMEQQLESLTARIIVKGEEYKIKGYYSKSKEQWCIVIPAGYQDQKVFLEAKMTNGEKQTFSRIPSEGEMIFTWKDTHYPIDFIWANNIETLYVTLNNKKDLNDVHESKKQKFSGTLSAFDVNGSFKQVKVKSFWGHGNDSWESEKKSYNLKFDGYADLLGMEENDDFVLLAGYRDNSLMSYVTTTELVREVGFPYAPEYRLVNLFVAGEYVGVYFLTEKIEIDKNRIDIPSVYEETKKVNSKTLDFFDYQRWSDEDELAKKYYYDVENNPEDITGGYLLEIDVADYEDDDSRFVSKRRIKLTMKRARYSSKEEVDYMWEFWTDFENALFSETGKNDKGKHYSEYIDVESFAMQWLFYELEQEGSLMSSIYYYKESDVNGDGLLHASYPWDMEHSYRMSDKIDEFGLATSSALKGYWRAFYQHEDFRNVLRTVWDEKIAPAVEKMISEDAVCAENGMKNLRWYLSNSIDMHMLENSRWDLMHPWDKCSEIEDILSLRLNVISNALKESGDH